MTTIDQNHSLLSLSDPSGDIDLNLNRFDVRDSLGIKTWFDTFLEILLLTGQCFSADLENWAIGELRTNADPEILVLQSDVFSIDGTTLHLTGILKIVKDSDISGTSSKDYYSTFNSFKEKAATQLSFLPEGFKTKILQDVFQEQVKAQNGKDWDVLDIALDAELAKRKDNLTQLFDPLKDQRMKDSYGELIDFLFSGDGLFVFDPLLKDKDPEVLIGKKLLQKSS